MDAGPTAAADALCRGSIPIHSRSCACGTLFLSGATLGKEVPDLRLRLAITREYDVDRRDEGRSTFRAVRRPKSLMERLDGRPQLDRDEGGDPRRGGQRRRAEGAQLRARLRSAGRERQSA